MTKKSYVTITDQFCGAGGSSIGAVAAGAELRLALNHWPLAIKTHNSNFPDAAHDCTDISACDPRRYPSTDILITAPECTNHSLAKGKMRKWQKQLELFGELRVDPAEERSRATMFDVLRFSETHQYACVIVENVVEARHWVMWDAWIKGMELLGYDHECVYFNSMFAYPTPQSRDRMYICFFRKGNRRPDLRFTPPAYCHPCGTNVQAVQAWKNPRKPWGKYKAQYIYVCPTCAKLVEPYYYAALNAIDWSVAAPRIGNRDALGLRPLKEKTLNRIRVGLQRFGQQVVLMDRIHSGRDAHMVWPATAPNRTQIGQATQAMIMPPFLVDTAHAGMDRLGHPVIGPIPTQTAQQSLALATPPFIVNMQANNPPTGIDAPLPTMLTGDHRYLAVPPFLLQLTHSDDRMRGLDSPMPTAMPHTMPSLVTPPFLVDLRGTNVPKDTSDVVSTVCASGNHHGMVVPPFLVSYYTRVSGQQAAVADLDAPMPTVPGRATHYLAQPGETPDVEECGFRMLQPHEIKRAMAFPHDYVVLGNQRDQIRQYGQAVTPPVMTMILERCLATLN